MKKVPARELSRHQPTLCFDVILQHDWPIELCLLHIRVFFGGKTKRPCFDLFIHSLIKQIQNTYRNHFSRVYENRSNIEGVLCMERSQNLDQKFRFKIDKGHIYVLMTMRTDTTDFI